MSPQKRGAIISTGRNKTGASYVSIEEKRDSILATVSKRAPVSELQPVWTTPVHSFWILELAEAISTLFVGYQVGSKTDEIGSALAYAITGIGDIAKAVAKVIDRLGDIVDAINRLLEVLSRKIDGNFMRLHMSKMESASLIIQEILFRLDKLPKPNLDDPNHPEPTHPEVQYQLQRMQSQVDNLFESIIAYLRQEGGLPSPAAIIACSSTIAFWAQSYTAIERYRPLPYRVGVWDLPPQKRIEQIFNSFFADFEIQRARFSEELITTLASPGVRVTHRFAGDRFVLTKIPYEDDYPNVPDNQGLFCMRVGYPFDPFATTPSGGLLPPDVPLPGRRLRWAFAKPSDAANFPNPQLIKDARKHYDAIQPDIQKRQMFLAQTDKIEDQKKLVLEIFTKPAGWS
ncbi:MAG: hypothetical protein WDM80_01605 [Limisphaerales bacterium]